ncbi:hypothetical protein ARTSIC4J27_2120 [Pseudarthrobacter siccitolerans]|uniref:Uncharacterized protein n=2 Tax=Pseudarthrobacter siccitolerans TaxID=861266 RepID=A0A024H1U6_9MICC|nr:hypothetical protein ARTSIC4J27_2120 [Pseudarthrobacter siccitolerans]
MSQQAADEERWALGVASDLLIEAGFHIVHRSGGSTPSASFTAPSTATDDWCIEHMETGDTLSVWTSLMSNLSNCYALERLVQRHSNVVHITGRGGGAPRGNGPVLMAWPDMEDIGKLVRYGRGIRAICLITGNADQIRPWVMAMKPDILGDGSDWETFSPDLDPIVIEALRSLTLTVNHNNTISAGYEKDRVVGVLLALRDARIPMDADAIQGWALAHGWAGKNPERLAQYVRDINSGKRPRARPVLRAEYIDHLRQKLASGHNDPDAED